MNSKVMNRTCTVTVLLTDFTQKHYTHTQHTTTHIHNMTNNNNNNNLISSLFESILFLFYSFLMNHLNIIMTSVVTSVVTSSVVTSSVVTSTTHVVDENVTLVSNHDHVTTTHVHSTTTTTHVHSTTTTTPSPSPSPNSIQNHTRKTLVLDLDETLVHCT